MKKLTELNASEVSKDIRDQITNALKLDKVHDIQMVSYKIEGDGKWFSGCALITEREASVIFDKDLNIVEEYYDVRVTQHINVNLRQMMMSNQLVLDNRKKPNWG